MSYRIGKLDYRVENKKSGITNLDNKLKTEVKPEINTLGQSKRQEN